MQEKCHVNVSFTESKKLRKCRQLCLAISSPEPHVRLKNTESLIRGTYRECSSAERSKRKSGMNISPCE